MSTKAMIEMAALRDALLDDLMQATSDEIEREVVTDGEDLAVEALKIKTTMREAAARTLRDRTALPRVGQAHAVVPSTMPTRPTLEKMKQLVQELFRTDPKAGLAFREGQKQTDADWQSLYDDLVRMGAIGPREDDEA